MPLAVRGTQFTPKSSLALTVIPTASPRLTASPLRGFTIAPAGGRSEMIPGTGAIGGVWNSRGRYSTEPLPDTPSLPPSLSPSMGAPPGPQKLRVAIPGAPQASPVLVTLAFYTPYPFPLISDFV